MPINEIKTLIESNQSNPEVQNYIRGLITPDRVTSFLDSEEGKRILQPKIDSHFTKGLETWKQNNLEKIVNEEVSKRYPTESPEQKRLRELELKLEQSEKDRTKESLRNKALSVATQKGLPVDLVDYFVGQDEENTINNLAKFESIFNTALQNAVESKFKEHGRNPNKGLDPKTELEQLETELAKTTDLARKLMIKRKIEELKKG